MDKINYKKNTIIKILDNIIDPEINVSIWKMGLIYEITITEDNLHILMTLTSPACPFSDYIFSQIESGLSSVVEIDNVEVELTFDPQWNPDMMSEEARLEAGLL